MSPRLIKWDLEYIPTTFDKKGSINCVGGEFAERGGEGGVLVAEAGEVQPGDKKLIPTPGSHTLAHIYTIETTYREPIVHNAQLEYKHALICVA